jgi:hypothetical protein
MPNESKRLKQAEKRINALGESTSKRLALAENTISDLLTRLMRIF